MGTLVPVCYVGPGGGLSSAHQGSCEFPHVLYLLDSIKDQ